ncbi:FHA domain-containing protein [bacterium]|nr:FHA domain-containing protein [bacterium]
MNISLRPLDDLPLGQVSITQPRFTIGRDANCDLQLFSPLVSHFHALLKLDDGRLTVIDLGSENGTWVNEVPVALERELHDGDALRIAVLTFRVRMTQGLGSLFQLLDGAASLLHGRGERALSHRM